MVAQYFADVTFWSSISRARWPFLEANIPVVVSLMVPLVTPLDELQMKPRLMMAALITGTMIRNTDYRSFLPFRAMMKRNSQSTICQSSFRTFRNFQ